MQDLLLPGLVAERKVDQEKGNVFKFEFDDEFFHAAFEIVKFFGMDNVFGQKGVALVFVDRDALPARGGAVFRTVAMKMPQFFSHFFGLALFAGAVGTVVDLDQSNYIGIERSDKLRDFVQVVVRSPQHPNQRKPALVSVGGVANIIQ